MIDEKLANQLDVQPADYFSHPSVLKEYENTLVIEKAINQLYADGVSVDEFIAQLRDEAAIRVAEIPTGKE